MIPPITDAVISLMELRKLASSAAMLCKIHDDRKGDQPVAGDKIRCTFSMGMNLNQPGEKLVFESGRVYDVVANSRDAGSRAKVIDYMRHASIHKEITDLLESFPLNLPAHVVLRDPVNGTETLATYPAFAGVTFMSAAHDAADQQYNNELEVGTILRAGRISSSCPYLTPGKGYKITKVEPACSCGDPECKAHGINLYYIKDDEGDPMPVTSPFSMYGELQPTSFKA
ncbi:hypothetical protein HWC07_gp039 [Pantoea phage vB_PagM_LIET2]|uniref:Uncharacterized protein n=1 Tax=Pantoea phage vB_PagM_LIET2 TaxID=2508071 RepID=A0A411AW14_9CAUD|nr:hypothetical protein HWC07_gp039 [Pantoea phage vB_PagM_LIET2]QAX92291.1 hypothetical protein LIET2_gp039 [Pantoea phage vB_PagM_LIET2]